MKRSVFFGTWGRKLIPFVGLLVALSFFYHESKIGRVRSSVSLFSVDYPQNESFQGELQLLREKEVLTLENETAIRRSLEFVSSQLKIPEGVFWCLMFQESRLNHLIGSNGEGGAVGIGQFSHFSFYEVNFHTDRFEPLSSQLFTSALGGDVRPVSVHPSDPSHRSSYYFIPTAVISTGIYFNNRFRHLQKVLTDRGYESNDGLLWLFAAMAYNKGTRSVLNIWNDTQKKEGREYLASVLTEPNIFFEFIKRKKFFKNSFTKIWSNQEASTFAKEFVIHMANIRDCSVSKDLTREGG